MKFFALFLLFFLSACGIYEEKSNRNFKFGADTNQNDRLGTSISYEEIRSKILQPSCLGCHSGRQEPNLSSYQQVKSMIEGIKDSALLLKTMPKRGPLAPNLQKLLRSWIESGAPEFARISTPTPSPTAFPVPTPLPENALLRPLSFGFLKQKVLTPNCNTCHSINNAKKIPEFENYVSFKESSALLETLIFGVMGDAATPTEKLMPPLKAPQLTEEQKAYILLWIQDGMKN